MKFFSFLYLFLLVSLASCQEKQSQMEWKYIGFNQIPGETLWKDYANAITKYEFKQVLNYNKDISFLLGDDSQDDALAEPNSIVFSTTDFGDTWHNTVFQNKLSDHYIIKDSRYISNKYPLVPMYLMLEDAIEKNAPFYKDYKEAIKNGARIDYPFEHELPNTDKYKVLNEYLELMQNVRKTIEISYKYWIK